MPGEEPTGSPVGSSPAFGTTRLGLPAMSQMHTVLDEYVNAVVAMRAAFKAWKSVIHEDSPEEACRRKEWDASTIRVDHAFLRLIPSDIRESQNLTVGSAAWFAGFSRWEADLVLLPLLREEYGGDEVAAQAALALGQRPSRLSAASN